MCCVRGRLRIMLVAVAFALAVVEALSGPHFLPGQPPGGIVWAQTPVDSTRDAPRITSLTHPTLSSITVNWQEADDTEVYWIYSVKSDGSDGRFQRAIPDPIPSRGASGQSDPVTKISHATTVTDLDDGTQYWFAVIGIGSPSEGSPKDWFSWSNWDRGATLVAGSVSLDRDVLVAEGGVAFITVTSTIVLESPLTVNYTIGADDDAATVDGDRDDYTGSSAGSIVMAAGATQGVILVVTNDDSDIDDGARETLMVTITLPEGSRYQLGENTSATVTIVEGVCDRTTKVRAAILDELADISNCVLVTDPDLSGITSALELSGRSVTELKARDFRGLTGLHGLQLNNNSLTSLPEDVFDGLTSLTTLYLQSNPGSPFTFMAELEQTAANQVKVTVAEAAPFDMTVTLSVQGGTLSTSAVVVPGGSGESPAITVTPSGDEPVTVSVVAASFPTSGVETDGVTINYDGIRTGLGVAIQAPTANSDPDQTAATDKYYVSCRGPISGSSAFCEIDPDNDYAMTKLFDLNGSVQSMAWDPVAQMMYVGMNHGSTTNNSDFKASLNKIDISERTVERIGYLPHTRYYSHSWPFDATLSHYLSALAWVDGTLYGMWETYAHGGPSYLVTVDTSDASINEVGRLDRSGAYPILAWDGETLYSMEVNAGSNVRRLVTIDRGNARVNATSRQHIGVGADSATWDGRGLILGDRALYSVDTEQLTVTQISPNYGYRINGLSYVPASTAP